MRVSKCMKRLVAMMMVMTMVITGMGGIGVGVKKADAAGKVAISKKKAIMCVGETLKLTVTNNKKKVKWSSNKKSVAKVDSKGTVTAKKVGKAVITAKIGNKKYKCTITVKKLDLSGSWAEKGAKKGDTYHAAYIKNGVFEIFWVNDVDKSVSIYWSGTYKNPKSASKKHTWTSKKNKARTDSALFSVLDDSKKFTYKNGQIIYRKSVLGLSSEVILERTDKDCSKYGKMFDTKNDKDDDEDDEDDEDDDEDTKKVTPTTVTSNKEKLKEYILENGFINANGSYTVSKEMYGATSGVVYEAGKLKFFYLDGFDISYFNMELDDDGIYITAIYNGVYTQLMNTIYVYSYEIKNENNFEFFKNNSGYNSTMNDDLDEALEILEELLEDDLDMTLRDIGFTNYKQDI